jgi:hypothetical protein
MKEEKPYQYLIPYSILGKWSTDFIVLFVLTTKDQLMLKLKILEEKDNKSCLNRVPAWGLSAIIANQYICIQQNSLNN